VFLERGPDAVELVRGGAVERVAHLGAVEGHHEERSLAVDPAEPRRDAHATGWGAPRLTPWAISRFWSAGPSTRRGGTPASTRRGRPARLEAEGGGGAGGLAHHHHRRDLAADPLRLRRRRVAAAGDEQAVDVLGHDAAVRRVVVAAACHDVGERPPPEDVLLG